LTTCSTLTRPDGGALQRQRYRHQHGVQPRRGHHGQHLGDHPIAAALAQQDLPQLLQRRRQIGQPCAVAQRSGLALQQRHIVLPVVLGTAFVVQPLVLSHELLAGDDLHPVGVQPRAHHLAGVLARHRVAIACHRHQAGARHPRGLVDVALERRGHQQQMLAFALVHLGHAEVLVLRVVQFLP
jgi:hypothetical protein